MPRTALTFPKRKTVENLVYNGDFEYAPPFTAATTTTSRWIDGTAAGSNDTTGIYGWGLFGSSISTSAQFDSTEKKFGNNSLKLSTLSGNKICTVAPQIAVTTQRIPSVLPNTTYSYSFWMKTNKISGDSAGAYIDFLERNGAGNAGLSHLSTQINTTTDWTYYSGSFTTASTCRFITPKIFVEGNTGTATLIMDAWFDDITLVKSPVQTRSTTNILRRKPVGGNIVYNGDFEILPTTNTAMTTSGGTFIDGTAAGSSTDATYGWFVYNFAGTRSAQFDTTTKYQGNGSLKLTTDGGSVGVGEAATASWARNNIPCEPNTFYRISVWVKSNYISGDATTAARCRILQATGAWSVSAGATTTVFTGLKTTQDWTQYTATITTSATARFLQVNMQVVGNDGAANLNMEVWFDNLTITQAIPRREVDNLLFNGNFEYAPPFSAATTTAARWIDGTATGSPNTEYPYGWRLTGTSTPGFTAQYDSSVKYSGNYSLKLSTTDATGAVSAPCANLDGNVQVRETAINVLPSTSYTVTGWCKTNNVKAGSATISIFEYNSTSSPVTSTQTNSLTGTNDWTQLTKTFTTNAATSKLVIICRNNVAGNVSDAWFDDITLVKN